MSIRPFVSMRWWFALAFALVSAVTALAVAQVFRLQSESALRGRAEDLAAGSAVGAAARIVASPDLAGARAQTTEQARRRRVALFLFGSDRSLLTHPSSQGVDVSSVPNVDALLDKALDERRTVQSLENGRRITVALPLRGPGPAAALVEVASRPDLVAAATIVRDRIWVAAAWATLVGIVAGIAVSLAITARVRRIAGAASAIERGKFDQELRPRFPDELGQLAQAVDAMRRNLSASFSRIGTERDQLRTLIEQLQEGIIGVHADLEVVVANARVATLLGETIREGDPLPEPWPVTDLRGFARNLFEPGARQAELQAVTQDNLTCAVTGLPPPTGGDTAVLVVTDVTERERRERAEREFVANAAHEVRTPLAAISSAVEVLQQGAKDQPAERDRFLAVIERQTRRLARLERALLTLAHAQTTAEPLKLHAVDLAAILRDVAEELGLPPSAIESDGPGLALGHEDLLRQAIENLARNAIKYAGGEGLVLRCAELEGGERLVEVRDRGPGMSAGEAERVVDRFFRGGSRDDEGFGLGLSIAREVAHAVGGDLEIVTQPGSGTTVRLRLKGATGRIP
jgi:signal transduction histidine kinase/HAMP domain-containing protein